MTDHDRIAQAFIRARAEARALADYPGPMPGTLAEAYGIQDRQLGSLVSPHGWKVAAIRPELRDALGEARLAGPMLHRIKTEPGTETEVPVIAGGFAAIEAEFIFRIGSAPVIGASPEELARCVASVHVGVEVAGSPLASLSSLGPLAVISDHGNNAAVLLGPEVQDGTERALACLAAQVSVNGVVVGQGDATRLPTGGPWGSLHWLADHLHRRGQPLRAGDWVATGAMTGVHPVSPGDLATIQIGPHSNAVRLTAAHPKETT